MVGLAWSRDPDSSAGSCIASQVKGDDPEGKEYSAPPGWELGVRLTISDRKNYYCYKIQNKPQFREAIVKGCQDSYRLAQPVIRNIIIF